MLKKFTITTNYREEMIDITAQLIEFIKSSKVYSQQSSASEKRILLNFFMSLIISDGEIEDNEMRLFVILTEAFNLDGDKFIENYFND